MSTDRNLELQLKSQPNSCFVKNYFDADLKTWWVKALFLKN